MAADRPVLGIDLNIAMLRLAQRLMVEGRVVFGQRRIGLVYDPVEVILPDALAGTRVDFWAADCLALPFRAGAFGLANAVNVVDCIAGPTNMLHEMARALATGAGAVVTTPYDWAETATDRTAWMGGHSDRGPLKGAGEQVLTATLTQAGLDVVAEEDDVPWHLRMHARAVMEYRLHMVGCRRAG
jgi:SAM-dependent methyltransferase